MQLKFRHRVTHTDIATARYNDPRNCFVCRCITRFHPGSQVTTDYFDCVVTLINGDRFWAKVPTRVANLLRDFDYSDGNLKPNPFDLDLDFEPYTGQDKL